MLINADVKSLEVVVAAELANDEVLKDEIVQKLDLHSLNQSRFSLPDRVTAKRFIFKLLYGATAYGYSVDSDFIDVGYSQKDWQGVIDEFYSKYRGIAKWHASLLETVKRHGYISIPSGRYFAFSKGTKYNPDAWPLTTIKNYPVQGFGADLVMLARVEAFEQFLRSNMEGHFVQTIHDSLVYDVPSRNVAQTAKILDTAIAKVPELCYNIYGYEFSLPMTCEIQVGRNKRDMEEYKLT